MDQGVAALLGAVVGIGGTAVTVGVQELRARAQDRRAHADELARIRGMTRMIGAELNSIRLKLDNARLQKPSDADFQFSTQAWIATAQISVHGFRWRLSTVFLSLTAQLISPFMG